VCKNASEPNPLSEKLPLPTGLTNVLRAVFSVVASKVSDTREI
jgi:hypothetical protein